MPSSIGRVSTLGGPNHGLYRTFLHLGGLESYQRSQSHQILGHLDANGYVVLQNQSGFYIGGNAVINAAG
jgi:hypothetical protein